MTEGNGASKIAKTEGFDLKILKECCALLNKAECIAKPIRFIGVRTEALIKMFIDSIEDIKDGSEEEERIPEVCVTLFNDYLDVLEDKKIAIDNPFEDLESKDDETENESGEDKEIDGGNQESKSVDDGNKEKNEGGKSKVRAKQKKKIVKKKVEKKIEKLNAKKTEKKSDKLKKEKNVVERKGHPEHFIKALKSCKSFVSIDKLVVSIEKEFASNGKKVNEKEIRKRVGIGIRYLKALNVLSTNEKNEYMLSM